MKRNEIIFSDIYENVVEKEYITNDRNLADKWHRIPYSTELTDGHMLLSYENDFPENITLKLGLTGSWKVYVATTRFAHNDNNYLHVKLSSQPCWTELKINRHVAPNSWQPSEFVQEILMFHTDLTGEDLVISRPKNNLKFTGCVLWVRCVPCDEKTDALFDFSNPEHKTMQYHFDSDLSYENRLTTVPENCMKEFAAAESDVDFVSQEFSLGQIDDADGGDEVLRVLDSQRIWDLNNKSLHAINDAVELERIKMAHDSGYRIYAAHRMQVSSFQLPYAGRSSKITFADNHPEHSAVWRDGTQLSLLSYAYAPVREFTINHLIDHLKKGYDGLSLILHRGIAVGFEEPVITFFNQKYPDADIHVLPLHDARVRECRCKFMTDFLTELKQQVDLIAQEQSRKIGINVITDYTPETALNFGLDIKEWAKRGLITEVSQGDMEIYEDLTDCMSDTDPAVIDLEKYKKENLHRQVLCRHYGTDPEKTISAIPELLELEDNYGVKVYNILPWVHTIEPCEFVDAAKQLYQAGARRLFMWNTLQCMQDPLEWGFVKRLGHKNDLDRINNQTLGLYNHYRVMSYADVNISLVSPNWRG
ncbi:MAG: hypothetical protein IJC55_03000 [Clostridia bacterium]|nr:hypothetical protein [Clostridia bacterium]